MPFLSKLSPSVSLGFGWTHLNILCYACEIGVPGGVDKVLVIILEIFAIEVIINTLSLFFPLR